ncbi:MAG: malonyl-ACP O-methyltransferase BioC [Candidatus Contendobacter sp.]|nr:malonyl-ACP O-methyltransferase BioC [Candidatus Contendobacter sp.]
MGDDDRPFELDRVRLRRAFEQAAASHDRAAFLHREVGQRLLERLNLIRLQPETILDVGCGVGQITAALLKKYRKARVIALERAPAMVARARQRAPWLRTLHGAVAEPEALPLPAASCGLVFSNLALPWALDLDRVFAEFRRVLKPGGALFFTTLGPDTLSELRRAWAAADSYNHVNAFFDMHDIGDALLRARLAEPVMDVERLTLTYPDVDRLMRDLKALGAGNVTLGRPRGLTGKGRLRTVQTTYEQYRRADGLLPATCEVVYGHAWGPSLSQFRPRADGPAVFPLSQLRRRDS